MSNGSATPAAARTEPAVPMEVSAELALRTPRLSFGDEQTRASESSKLTPPSRINSLKLQAIHRFTSTADAVEDMTSIGEGKVSKSLKKFLTEEMSSSKKYKNEKLVVSEPKLGGAIAKKLELAVVSDSSVNDLYRGIRTQLSALLGDVDPKDISTMELGLSHSVSRCVCAVCLAAEDSN